MVDKETRQDQHFWNGIALAVFAGLCTACLWLVARFGVTDFAALGALDILLLGVATFRLLHLITYDKIFDLVRTAFMERRGAALKVAARGWRRAVCELMQCLWCTGMWSGLLVVTAYLLGWWGRFAVLVLAVAGVGSLLQLVSRALAAAGPRDD